MKKIAFSADEQVIRQAKLVARTQCKSLNTEFREWLVQFVGHSGHATEAEALMIRLCHVKGGRRFTRDEMNES
jgi:hypothetical protein